MNYKSRLTSYRKASFKNKDSTYTFEMVHVPVYLPYDTVVSNNNRFRYKVPNKIEDNNIELFSDLLDIFRTFCLYPIINISFYLDVLSYKYGDLNSFVTIFNNSNILGKYNNKFIIVQFNKYILFNKLIKWFKDTNSVMYILSCSEDKFIDLLAECVIDTDKDIIKYIIKFKMIDRLDIVNYLYKEYCVYFNLNQ